MAVGSSAVDGLDTTRVLGRGEVFGLVGETGRGKSTVARSLCGIYRPTEGEVLYEGIRVSGSRADRSQVQKMQAGTQMICPSSASSATVSA